jgi:plastocyanin
MDGNETVKNNKSAIWIAIAVVVVIAAGIYLWFYGNPFAARTSAAITVNIASCDSVSPQIAVLADGATLAFVNSDGNAHRISIGGEEVGVPANGSANLAAKFQYGAGTYGYACDGKLTPNQIVLVPVPGSASVAAVAFKSVYDGESAAVQTCLKSALGTEFDKAYGDPNYVPSNDTVKKVNDCFSK